MWISYKCRQGQTKFITASEALEKTSLGNMQEHGEQNRYEPEQLSWAQMSSPVGTDNQHSSNFCGTDNVCSRTTHAKSSLSSPRSSWVVAKWTIFREYLLPSSYFFLLPYSPQGFPEWLTGYFASLWHFLSLISLCFWLPVSSDVYALHTTPCIHVRSRWGVLAGKLHGNKTFIW